MAHIHKNICGKVLKFQKEIPSLHLYDNFQAVGGKIWPASDVLIEYFADNIVHGGNSLRDKNVLELGSGCGVAGIACAAMVSLHMNTSIRSL